MARAHYLPNDKVVAKANPALPNEDKAVAEANQALPNNEAVKEANPALPNNEAVNKANPVLPNNEAVNQANQADNARMDSLKEFLKNFTRNLARASVTTLIEQFELFEGLTQHNQAEIFAAAGLLFRPAPNALPGPVPSTCPL
ncbi:hypothetical protein PCANC_24643 [Puccinia coronata f. sp. avenae]|uniref:Uncharacterized protein n=1 Tax=Puccinia coronata f. sp. avenae TaxID=200324 RepID=A0A2N5TE15_9BASI|nr:hypothetical protein PCANC_28150 [Puccinia coronata f. sp. avenae]PLW32663.1 hypothetical protein PCANC_24643 [Puccinia coronata f. sp. avenae]